MLSLRSTALIGCVLAIVVSTPGCLVRTRIISKKGRPGTPRTLITATRDDLVRRLIRQYEQVRYFNATVDMTPATGSVYKGQITEYKDIRAYILYRKPADIRVIGLAPVVRSKLFDMVSRGDTFRIFVSPKNRFIEGRNDALPESKNTLENLRPEAFLKAMVVTPPDAAKETPLLVDSTDEETAFYVLVIIGKTPTGELMIDRTVFFDRTSLLIARQKEYDSAGTILSDTQYEDWKTENGLSFPRSININRPKDGYGVEMNVVKLDTNTAIGDDKFALEQPPGTQLQIIGATATSKGPTR